MLMDSLESCCIGLDSSKVTERRKCVETIKELINKPQIIKSLNESKQLNWDFVFTSFHRFIKREGEKLYQDENKQIKNTASSFRIRSVADIFYIIVTKANTGTPKLSVTKIIESCFQCFNSCYLKKYFGFIYLKILEKNVLSIREYWGQIDNNRWQEIFQILKEMYNESDSINKDTIIQSLYLTVKYGTLHSSLTLLLRQEFEFIINICLEMKNRSGVLQENTLHLLIEFNSQLSNDCRIQSCILGEKILRLLIDILINIGHENYGGKKSLIFDYLLLQIRLHHPNGVSEGNNAAYAVNWKNWKTILRSLYYVLCNEVDIFLRNHGNRVRPNDNNFPKLWPNFLELFVEVSKQVFSCIQSLNITQSFEDNDFNEYSQIAKKRKLDIGISSIITSIKSPDNWPWLSILGTFIQYYPSVIEPNDFIMILDVAATLQSECKDTVSRHYLYKLLIEMVKAQDCISQEYLDKERLDLLWIRIWDTSLRLVGLNQNEETTHKLIQIMLENKKNLSPISLLSIYTSGVLNISKYSIETLCIICKYVSIPEFLSNNSDINIKKYLINFIWNNDKLSNNFLESDKITAQLLVGLVTKIWPYPNIIIDNNELIHREFKCIENSYLLTSFEAGLVEKKQIESQLNIQNKEEINYLLNSEIFDDLSNHINQYISHLHLNPCTSKSEIINLINRITLLIHMLSEFIDIKILSEDNIINFINIGDLFNILLESLKKQTNNDDILILMKQIEYIFTLELNPIISKLIRNECPVEFLQYFFEFLNTDDVDGKETCSFDFDDDDLPTNQNIKSNSDSFSLLNENMLNVTEKLQLTAMKILSCYCCVSNLDAMQKRQKQVLETLITPEYDPNNNVDFQMNVSLLKSLMICKIGTLTEKNIQFCLKTLQKLMIAKYQSFEAADILLKILKDSIPHINASTLADAKLNLLSLLNPFYDRRECYGPKLLVTIAECMGQIINVNTLNLWPNIKELMIKLITFLKSNYLKVRFASINNILYIFNIDSNTTKTTLQMQETLLNEIKTTIKENFTTVKNLNVENLIDEPGNCTATALHMFVAIISTNTIWRKQMIFAFMELISDENINIDLINKVLSIIIKYLNIKDINEFLITNINYLISQWNRSGRNLSEFPFKLFNCETEIDFFVKYLNDVVPVLLQQENLNQIKALSLKIQKPVTDIIKECYPVIISEFLPISIYSKSSSVLKISGADVLISRKIINQINNHLLRDENDSNLLIEMFDQIYIQLINRFYDLEHFEKQFNFGYILPEPDPPFFDFGVLQITLEYIENKLSNDWTSMVVYLIQVCPNKLEYILFEVTSKLYNTSSIEEQLLSLHRYSIFIDYILPKFEIDNELNTFIMRSIICNLMNLVKLNQNSKEIFAIAICKYFKKIITKYLPVFSKIFEKFLILVVSTLVPIAKLNTNLSKESVNILNFLIIDNSKYLYNSIGALDPFPKEDKFFNIQQIYEKIKYGNDVFNLEQEIRHFLNVGHVLDDICDRTEGLQHLRQQLADKKTELQDLYNKLHQLRNFCENSQESIIHQLICMLVQMTSSSIDQVKLEAARCLGELGPSDLTTLVLKPEKCMIVFDISPLELIAGQIIPLLAKYLVSQEIKLSKVSSEALYVILNSKEGSRIMQNGNNIDYGCGVLIKSYVYPFLPINTVPKATLIKINETTFIEKIEQSNLWCPQTQFTHSEWIINLVSELLNIFPENCFLRNLIPVCQVKVQFAEKILPLIIFILLTLKKKYLTFVISKQIQLFFEIHWQETISNPRRSSISQTSTDNNSFIVYNRASVQCMLNVVHFIRIQQKIYNSNIVDELNLNYLHIAQAAQFCEAYFTSILYAELWCYKQIEEQTYDGQSTKSTLEMVCLNESSELTLAFQNILREGYKKIGDTDAIHGCGTSYILDTKSRNEYYKNIGRWDKVVLYHNRQLSNDTNISNDLVNALKKTALYNLASTVPTDDINSQFECAWRLNQWDFTEKTKSHVDSNNLLNDYEKYHYLALKTQREQDFRSMNQAIIQSRFYIINSLSYASLESSKSIYKSLGQLKMLQDIEDFAQARQNDTFNTIYETWNSSNNLNKNEFEYIEPIIAQRITLLTDIFKNDTSIESIRNYLVDMYLQMAKMARSDGFYHVAQQSLDSISSIKEITPELKGHMLYEQAQLSWLDDKKSGRYLLEYLLKNNHTISLKLYVMVLTLYGNWMVETRSENPTTIIDNYFKKSLNILMESENNVENRSEALNSLARFAHAQYQQVSDYTKSSSFQSKMDIIKKSLDMATKIKRNKNTSDERRAIMLYERQSKIDESEVNNVFAEKNMYLTLAIRNYLEILEYCDSYNLKVFQVLSLSLENKTNIDLMRLLAKSLTKIPAYKFIPLLPQLVPHIVNINQNDEFEKIIHVILERCALDHPHHTLPVILALADSYKDRNYDSSVSNESTTEPRVQVAKDLITKLKKKKSLTQIINNMELVSTALVSLAYVDATKCTKRGYLCVIPRGETIKNIKHFDNVLVPTINMEIRKNCNYNNIIGIREFSNTFSLVGGVNAPKQITCIGTDGIERIQLVKGKDDLRQDAVMQQVFNIMNTLLTKDKQTSKLLIRTYKVVPLSQRSGIIEWCANTEPLGVYLNNAHKKYHPTDWTPMHCREQLKSVQMRDPNTKYRKYKEICAKLRPVFHMFFISSYPQSTVWFERRRAYMHSVATSSMVGYILGLGDRHVQNILLDTNTAEVIHIDFGIAFEQGKCLPTPETVPFRLTRDIEAGMGICGVEGVFRRSCEKTMQVLRQNAETVITILQVLLYDPLYVWTITPAEAYSRQKDDDEKTFDFSEEDSSSSNLNITAERALLRLKEKLQGMENGALWSVEGQVELLLQQARDPVNLSRLFNGWQPYL